MSNFHALAIDEIRAETIDSASLRFAVPEALRADFAFTPGQHLTLRATIDGADVRRSYSICSALDDGELRIAIRRVAGGRFSNWALDTLKPGDRIDVMPPAGSFGPPPAPERACRYVAFAAGSGITPVLSIVASVLAREPRAEVTLVYGNRRRETTMFHAALEDLRRRHQPRMTLLHVLSGDADGMADMAGRIDRPRLDALLAAAVDARRVDHFLLCGPGTMVETLREGLLAHGVAAAAIRAELFTTAPADTQSAPAAAATGPVGRVVVLRDGARRDFVARLDGGNLVDAAEAAGIELPYSCKGGVCATCRCKVTAGRVEMLQNFALSDDEVAAGFILACQSHPITTEVTIDFDAT
ncbi:MAG: 2Fe-2S iron-sulfur cluster binding domain-containing protein [Alphaproteobacteria bacterium]|nr:2Fe-2S iron-sulfur cluster binding domain-containing protein [Alphaproteobacteria bacterium]